MNPNVIVPVVLFITSFGTIFGIVYLRTRENMAILDRGKDPRAPRPYNSLKAGLLFLGAGLGLLLAYLIDTYAAPRGDSEALYFALIAVGGGGGLISSYFVEKKAMDKNPDLFR